MKHLELHILQSVPVACLNRDDFGSPKTAIFGGVQRARVSSQSWKRAIREFAQEMSPQMFAGSRTRLIIEPLQQALKEQYAKLGQDNKSDDELNKIAISIAEVINKLDNPPNRIKTLFFTSSKELADIAKAYVNDEKKDVKKAVKMGNGDFKDAADIALFGRMVANDHSLTLEGAAMFAHALSTHKVSNEIDFFAAVDDWQSKDQAGAGMTGTLEYNSATYYRFAALNLDMLADIKHLGGMTVEERQDVVRVFIESTIKAMPSARKNSMNANTLPNYILAVVREKGHPIQLVNAFELPIWSKNGFIEESCKRLEAEYEKLSAVWGISACCECRMPDKNLAELMKEVLPHVK